MLNYTVWQLYTTIHNSEFYIPFLQRIIPSIELRLNEYDQRTRQVYMDTVRAHIKRKSAGVQGSPALHGHLLGTRQVLRLREGYLLQVGSFAVGRTAQTPVPITTSCGSTRTSST
ncbi:hypothetical protein RvY_06048-2 [Ramazzottius varieornatus]|uniref:Uncharacterized protein n=1 Tax=Ramazzottius varieornatus TaxID=947166 RepID=A0A1D1V0R2_RAMVA|nr:hypothetical protein RvY_06048-2 [Ramazzottius varieornatus]